MTEYRTGIVLPMWAWGIIIAVVLGLPSYSYARLQSQVDRMEGSLQQINQNNFTEVAALRTEQAVQRVQISQLNAQIVALSAQNPRLPVP